MTLRTSRALAAAEFPSTDLHPASISGPSSQPRRDGNSLVELAKDYPEETARFLLRGLILSASAGLCIGVPCELLLIGTWDQRALCDQPLRPWIMVAGLLHLVQFPLRLICYRWLSAGHAAVGSSLSEGIAAEHNVGQLVASVVSDVMLSRTWRTSQVVSCLSIAWLIIGVVWVFSCSSNHACPEVGYATAVLITAVVRLFFSFMSFRITFSREIDGETPDRAVRQSSPLPPQEAVELDVPELPLLRCPSSHSTTMSGAVCAICLGAFRRKQGLRLLPCRHFFHERCIDGWLKRRHACPLCRSEDLSWNTAEQGPAKLP